MLEPSAPLLFNLPRGALPAVPRTPLHLSNAEGGGAQRTTMPQQLPKQRTRALAPVTWPEGAGRLDAQRARSDMEWAVANQSDAGLMSRLSSGTITVDCQEDLPRSNPKAECYLTLKETRAQSCAQKRAQNLAQKHAQTCVPKVVPSYFANV